MGEAALPDARAGEVTRTVAARARNSVQVVFRREMLDEIVSVRD
jgi:hypothetical protein